MHDFPKLTVVNLSDLYLTRTDALREFKKIEKSFNSLRRGCLCFGISLGILYALVYDLMKRVDALEKEKDETAG